MVYKFKSSAGADVILLGPHGDRLLKLLGREPAAQGLIEVAAQPAALLTLQAAIDAEEAAARAAAAETAASPDRQPDADPGDDNGRDTVSLRQRLWPFMDLLRRSQAEQARVVWGV